MNWEQAHHLVAALGEGDSDAGGVLRQAARQVLAGLFGATD